MSNAFRRILLAAALSGFIALSWEIIWARLYNFATGSRATAFGAMLGSYLLGLALGSLWSMKWHHNEDHFSLRSLGRLILGSALLAFLVVPLASWIVTLKNPDDCWIYLGWFETSICLPPWSWTLPLVALAAALQGTTLPLMCHVAIPADEKAGSRLSYVYLANIIGSGAGSLLTGFWLMEMLPLRGIAALLAVLTLVLVMIFGLKPLLSDGIARLLAVVLIVFAALTTQFHNGIWDRLFWKHEFAEKVPFPVVMESRHGIITIDKDRKVYGNGAYDGEINTSLTFGDYHVRPYFISAVHPGPLKRVLVIGMSAGAWTQIIANHPDQPDVDVVEISHGYIDIIAAYPQVSSLLKNPRVKINIDDGRRWLKRQPDRKFDCILMNTTHHWREFASGLLSQEFLQLANQHLAPDGVVMWNCTDSPRAAKTGMLVFPHTLMCLNNCIASNKPLEPNQARWREVLSIYKIDGKPVFDLTTEAGKAELEKVLKLTENDMDPPTSETPDRWWIVKQERMHKLWDNALPITDDNLGHEYPAKE